MPKREHIIKNAIELFAEKGFEGTSIRELAAKANVNVAMVNYYFGSKEKLFEAMIELKASYMKGIIEELVKDKTKSEIEKIDTIIENYVTRLLSNPNFHRVLHQEMLMQNRSELNERITGIFLQNTNNFKSIIEQGVRKKIFRKVDPELMLASIIGTINQVMLSKNMCNIFLQKGKDYDPYTDEKFRNRLLTHLKQMTHTYLLNN